MDTQDLKDKMMKLWKTTFHDSDEYISLIFDNYFNTEYLEYYEENGKLISALLGVPYFFGNGKQNIKGLYLCGLATLEEYRHRGIMDNLMRKINTKAYTDGFHITFLVPASDILRKYYFGKGYSNSMYTVEDRYTDIHDFNNDYQSILSKEDERIIALKTRYYESLFVDKLEINNSKIVKDTIEYIKRYEESGFKFFSLIHSGKDIAITFQENAISGGDILVCRTPDNKITGVAFITFDERKRIIIPKLYHDDNCSYFRLLDATKKKYPESSMSVKCYPEETDRRILWSKVYGAANPDGGMLGGSYGVAERIYDVNRHAKPYGMSRILNYREILKILTEWRKDCKFSILVKDVEEEGNYLKCDADSGITNFETIPASEIDKWRHNSRYTILKKQDLTEILFRKKDSNNLIMDALGIPRLTLNMSLLLD